VSSLTLVMANRYGVHVVVVFFFSFFKHSLPMSWEPYIMKRLLQLCSVDTGVISQGKVARA
jgi:hypothetical protein